MNKFKTTLFLVLLCFLALPLQHVHAEVENISDDSNGATNTNRSVETGHTHTFVFYNGSEIWKTTILKNDETLKQPANPSRENQVFIGWYKDSSFTEAFDGFNQPATLDDGETKLYAKFKNVYYITYKDINGNVIQTDEADEGSTYTIVKDAPLFVLDNPAQKHDGWKDQNNNKYTETQNIIVNENITLTPIISDGVFVRYFTDGGTPIESEFVPLNEKATEPSNPTKRGYTFSGWYKDSNYSEVFDFSTPLTDNVDVYAKWSPAEVTYTVAYWQENADDDGFSFYESVTGTALAGTIIGESDLRSKDLINNRRYLHFYYDHTESAVVNGEETTIINVYYKAYRHTLIFTGKTIDGEEKRYTVTDVKAYQDTNIICDIIEDINYDETVYFMHSSTWKAIFRRNLKFMMQMISGTRSYTISFSQRTGSITTHRYLFGELTEGQELSDDDVIREFEGKEYVLFSENHVSGSPYGTYFGNPIGYTPYAAVNARGERFDYPQVDYFLSYRGNNYIYYTKHQHDIKYQTNIGDTIDPVVGVYYNYVVEPYITNSYEEDITTRVINGVTYIFKGWYKDQAFIEKADFSTMFMPDHDLLLYAKWEALKSTVTFDPNFGSDSGTFDNDTEVIVDTGTKIGEPSNPQRNSNSSDYRYVFLGWILNGKPYDFNSPVAEDITLVAAWGMEPVPTFKVNYNSAIGSGSVVDDNKYLMSSHARVLYGSIVAPQNYYFVYWKDSNDNIYYPNELVGILDRDVLLTAVYHMVEKTSLIYNLNYSTFGIENPNGVNVIDSTSETNLLINSIILLRDPTDMEMPAGYRFGGWYLNKECTGESVTRVIIDNNNPLPNMVYAKWIPLSEEEDKKDTTDIEKSYPSLEDNNPLIPQTGYNTDIYVWCLSLSIIGLIGGSGYLTNGKLKKYNN